MNLCLFALLPELQHDAPPVAAFPAAAAASSAVGVLADSSFWVALGRVLSGRTMVDWIDQFAEYSKKLGESTRCALEAALGAFPPSSLIFDHRFLLLRSFSSGPLPLQLVPLCGAFVPAIAKIIREIWVHEQAFFTKPEFVARVCFFEPPYVIYSSWSGRFASFG
jgi:hypothetical protein